MATQGSPWWVLTIMNKKFTVVVLVSIGNISKTFQHFKAFKTKLGTMFTKFKYKICTQIFQNYVNEKNKNWSTRSLGLQMLINKPHGVLEKVC